MSRKNHAPSSTAAAMLSASVILASGAAAQSPVTKPVPAAPISAAATSRLPRSSMHIKFADKYIKYNESLSVAGVSAGNPIFKTAQGEYFQVDPTTGDLKFLSAETLGYQKMGATATRARTAAAKPMDYIKFDGMKEMQRLSVAGVDDQGHVIQANSRGEKFYLAANGDMVFVR